jgi:putative acetyltransferase
VWVVKLKDGREVTVRFLTPEDKERLSELFASMSDEALKWGMPPYTKDVIERWINNIPNLIPIVAETNNRLVGYATIFKYPHPRRKGVSDLGMYLHQDYHNVGLGTALLTFLLDLAKKQGVHRIGLHVIADNAIAIHLYEKFGFKIEGVMKEAYFGADGKYHDEIVMGRC